MDDFRPWTRNALAPDLLDDDDAAWAAFEAYAYQPNRNMGRLARERRTPLEGLYRWSKRYLWEPRVKALDQHLSDIREEIVDATAAELGRMAALGVRVMTAELVMLHRLQVATERAGAIPPATVVRGAEAFTKIAQLLAGRPTERVALEDDLSALTDEEIEALAAMRAKLGAA